MLFYVPRTYILEISCAMEYFKSTEIMSDIINRWVDIRRGVGVKVDEAIFLIVIHK